MGDPHGIGPETLLKALAELGPESGFQPVVFGSARYLSALARDLGLSLPHSWLQVHSIDDFPYPPSWGRLDRRAGELAVASLAAAARFCRDGGARALVTAPINKAAAARAGFSHPGQTEFVASHFPGREPAMAFFSRQLNVLLATVHIPLREVFERLTPALLVEKTRLFHAALRRLGRERPRLALCGLNPHASEGGLFGDEEETVLAPALEVLRRELGREAIDGPHPSDTIFRRAAAGEFDGVIALYHDQGLIPLKLLAFDSAVNTTLGLPIVRVSPDHGTAFDIAGRGVADPGSMVEAIRLGLRLAPTSPV